MRLVPVILLLIFFSLHPGRAQQVIGLPKGEVQKVIREEYSNFMLDNSTRNTTFKYLKYIDKLNEQTLLCMLSEDDICTSTKLISDYMNLGDVIKELDSRYTKAGDNTWKYTFNNKKLIVTLKKEKWFFSVVTKPEQKMQAK